MNEQRATIYGANAEEVNTKLLEEAIAEAHMIVPKYQAYLKSIEGEQKGVDKSLKLADELEKELEEEEGRKV